MWLEVALSALALVLGVSACLYHINNSLCHTPEKVEKLAGRPWTKDDIQEAYEKCRKERPTFHKDLPQKQNRRYIVVGGSGLVGGWMIEHLIMRGEDPAAIRIADLLAPRRELALKHKIQYIQADVTDRSAVEKIFSEPWPAQSANLPLTVLHTVAFIQPGYRTRDFLDKYMKVNVEGTRNVLTAARSAGCDIFIVTSSASVGIKPSNFFYPPWQKYPQHHLQVLYNADHLPLDKPENFAGNYAYTKALAERLVTDADSKKGGFRTGAIRPGHAIYGHGDENRNSVIYEYLQRRVLQTWLEPIVLQYVSAQNVSLAHLLFEQRLLEGRDIGGNAYSVSDANPPVRYTDMYRVITTLAHPATPMKYPHVPPVVIILATHIMEAYILLQHRYLSFLPPATHHDLQILQPAMLNFSTLNVLYDNARAREELGYNPRHDTLEGMCLHLLEWNEKVERKLQAEGKLPKDASTLEKSVPVAPRGVAI